MIVDETYNTYEKYLNPNTSESRLDRLKEATPVLVWGYGVTTFIDALFQTIKGLKIYVGHDGANVGRFGYCHAISNSAVVAGVCDCCDLDTLVGVNHKDVAIGSVANRFSVEAVIKGLSAELDKRRNYYLYDNSLLHHPELFVAIDDFDEHGIWLEQFLKEYGTTANRYKVNLFIGLNGNKIPQYLRDIEPTEVVVGEEFVNDLIFVANEWKHSYSGVSLGLVNWKAVQLRLPHMVWIDGQYRELNTSINYGRNWNKRIENSEVKQAQPLPFRLSGHRHILPTMRETTAINIPVEIELQDVDELHKVNPSVYLSDVFAELERAFPAHDYFAGKLLDKATEYVLLSNPDVCDKAKLFIKESKYLLIELMEELRPLVKQVKRGLVSREIYRVLSSRELIAGETLSQGLRTALIQAEFPTSKTGIADVLTLSNLVAQRLQFVGAYFIEHPELIR